MNMVVVEQCPQCSAPVDPRQKACSYCHSPILVRDPWQIDKAGPGASQKYLSAYRNIQKNASPDAELEMAVGICHLHRGSIGEARRAFEKAVELVPEDSAPYFYAALTQFQGKRPFLAMLPTIRKAAEYLHTAISMEDSGAYYYLLYQIYSDYYVRKRLNPPESVAELWDKAVSYGVSEEDKKTVETYLPVPSA